MKKKHVFIMIVLLTLGTMAIVYVAYTASFLRPSPEHIHGKLLKYTPLGCDKKQVIEFVHAHGFQIRYEGNEPEDNRGWPPYKVGNSYIRVYLGHYQGIPFRCDVTVYWVFDENNKLIYIDIWKDYEGL